MKLRTFIDATGEARRTNKPKVDGVETLVVIKLQYRGSDKPNLAAIGRLVGRASGLLRVEDLDERLELQNKAAFQVARDLGLMR